MADAIRQRHGVGTGRAGSWRHRPGWCGTNRRCARLHPALEGFDDDHAPAATRTRRPRLRQFDWFCRIVYLRHREQRTGACDIGLAAGAREQAIVPNAVKGRWCISRAESEMTLAPRRYAMTRIRRTESGPPAASIWFSTATPMATSVC